MGVKLLTETVISDQYENEYYVEIIDTDFSGSPEIVQCSIGLALEYESQSDERFAPIKGSKFTCPVLVNSSAVETFLTDKMLNATDDGEDRFLMAVYKNSDLFWVGVILPDLCTRKDASFPYQFDLVATDGLARLKDLQFDLMLTNATDSQFDKLYQILKKTPLYQYISAPRKFFSTACNWYEDNMPTPSATTDPWRQTYARRWGLVDINQENTQENKALSYYDCLEVLLNQFNSRIMLSDGIFRIVTINLYEKTNILYERVYDADGLFLSTSSPGWRTTINRVDSWQESGANQWQYYPAIRSVSLVFQIGKSQNLIPASVSIATTPSAFNNVAGTGVAGGPVLRFVGVYRTRIVTFPTGGTISTGVVYTFKLKVGSYYAASIGVNGPITWTTNPSSRVFVGYPVQAQLSTISVSFITEPIPSGIHSSCEISLVSVQTASGGAVFVINLSQSLDSGEDYEFETTTIRNTTNIINSKDYELQEARYGDGSEYARNNVLFTGDDTSITGLSSSWKLDGTGTGVKINRLRVQEVIAGQKKPIPRYQGNIIVNTSAHFALVIYSKKHIFNGFKWDLLRDTLSGEWFEIIIDRTGFDVIDDGTPSENPQLEYAETISDSAKTLKRVIDSEDKYIDERFVTDITADITGTVSSITVGAIPTDLYAGQKLILTPYELNTSYEVELSADATAGSTALNIVSFTPGVDIESGASVFYPLYSPVLESLRVTSGSVMFEAIPTTDPGIPGMIYRDGRTLKISI